MRSEILLYPREGAPELQQSPFPRMPSRVGVHSGNLLALHYADVVAAVATCHQGVSMPTRYRDADTGHYITEQDAKKNPKQSVKETDKPKPKSPSKPKGK